MYRKGTKKNALALNLYRKPLVATNFFIILQPHSTCETLPLFRNSTMRNVSLHINLIDCAMKKFLRSIPAGTLSAIVTALIIYLSLASDPFEVSKVKLFAGADKVIHVIMYLGATMVYIYEYVKHCLPHHSKLDKELVITASAIVLGLLMEMAQLFLNNGRTYELSDWFADIIGAVLGFLVMHFILNHYVRSYFLSSRRRHHRHHHHQSEES